MQHTDFNVPLSLTVFFCFCFFAMFLLEVKLSYSNFLFLFFFLICVQLCGKIGNNQIAFFLNVEPITTLPLIYFQVMAPQASACPTCYQVTPLTCHLRHHIQIPCCTASWQSSLTCRCWSR